MTAPSYRPTAEIPAGACTWPDHSDADCPQCAVMRACMAQIPDGAGLPLVRRASELASWALRHGYRGAAQMPSDLMPGVLSPDCQQLAQEWAGRVAARLIAWVRWPGREHRGYYGYGKINGRWRAQCLECGRKEAKPCKFCDPLIHPLDATPAGGLRPATVGFSAPEIAMDLAAVHDGLLYGCDVTPLSVATDWSALAVITDVMEPYGLWSALHDWRAREPALLWSNSTGLISKGDRVAELQDAFGAGGAGMVAFPKPDIDPV